MAQSKTPHTDTAAQQPQPQALCPTCGKPRAQCKCIARWEDEGGATDASRRAEEHQG